jgi:hypothetical protein
MVPQNAPARSKRPQSTLLARSWWVGVLVILIVAGVLWAKLSRSRGAEVLTGYVTHQGVLQDEYQRYLGKALNDIGLETKFRNAEALTMRRDYAGAAAILETVLTQAPVPAVYNNLGVLYAEINDRGHALNAFRDGLARDGSYTAIRHNMDRLKQLSMDSGDPVSEEIEPNGTLAMANPIAVNKAVEGTIVARRGDEDTFRFVSPPAPRDVLAIRIWNVSADLIPGLRVYNTNNQMIANAKAELGPGSPLTQYLSSAPNSTFYLQVSGLRSTAGAYELTVQAMRAFDAYESNDGIFSARRIVPGSPIEANIMDAEDTDYYEFTAPRSGLLSIQIENRSTTLIPALATFSPDRRNTGFGPDLRTPGTSLSHRIDVEQNQTYFIQVWSQGSSAGAYRLTVGN